MIPDKDEYPMEQLKCQRCGGRLLDIGTDSPKKVEMETKCPNCNNLVTAVWQGCFPFSAYREFLHSG